MKYGISLVILLLFAIGASISYIFYYYTAPGPLTSDKTIIFPHEGFRAMAGQLEREGVISHPFLFETIAAASGQAGGFKAGEYAFVPGITPAQIIEKMVRGEVVIHKITIPEGLTTAQIVALLNADATLRGDVPQSPAEGSLLPQTYNFTYGDKRADIVKRMQSAGQKALADAWAARQPNLPLATPQQALILASIVEKETGLPAERGHIASVFYNRLKLGMKLQSDPTTAYGIGKPGTALTLADLQSPTPYNTYVIDGLPPTPICNPGQAAIEAALNPPDTNDLYFVATGTGGHHFAATLNEHNANVQAYRAQAAKAR